MGNKGGGEAIRKCCLKFALVYMDDEETDHCFGIVVVYTCNKFGRLGFKKLR